jgi:hypothetical protein
LFFEYDHKLLSAKQFFGNGLERLQAGGEDTGPSFNQRGLKWERTHRGHATHGTASELIMAVSGPTARRVERLRFGVAFQIRRN